MSTLGLFSKIKQTNKQTNEEIIEIIVINLVVEERPNTTIKIDILCNDTEVNIHKILIAMTEKEKPGEKATSCRSDAAFSFFF